VSSGWQLTATSG